MPRPTRPAARASLGLDAFLTQRTAVEPGEPVGVNILKDEIAFYPVLYWPVLASARALPEATLAKIDAYMKQGGMIIFDTQDFRPGPADGLHRVRGEGGAALQRLIGNARHAAPGAGAGAPRADQVVLPAALLPRPLGWRPAVGRGRYRHQRASDQGGRKAQRADGVTSIIVTSNDFAAAWALDDRGPPLYPVVPGASSSARWRSAPASTSSCMR